MRAGGDQTRLLIVRTSAVGDVVCALPALEAIRAAYPKARIGFVVEDRARDLISGHPAVDRVHLFPRKRWSRDALFPSRWRGLLAEMRDFVREMRDERYDVSVDLQRNLKGGVLSLLSGAEQRVGLARGWAREGGYLFSHVRVAPPPEAKHFADYFRAVAAALGASYDEPVFRLPASPHSGPRVDRFVREARLRNYAVIHPGTSDFGRAKRWPAERFAELARRIRLELDLPCVVAWGPGERETAEEVVRRSDGGAILAFETRSILDLAELIRGARVFVGCDSGPLHLSVAVKTPCVGLYGPKDPAFCGPYRFDAARVVRPPEGIGPASGISVTAVYRATKSLLASESARR